jgi:Uncharacterised protein family (UPF0093)
MSVTWLAGLYLAWSGHWFASPWLHAKLTLVIVLSGVHGFFSRWVKDFAADRNIRGCSTTFQPIKKCLALRCDLPACAVAQNQPLTKYVETGARAANRLNRSVQSEPLMLRKLRSEFSAAIVARPSE